MCCNEISNPASCCHKFTVGTLLDVTQVLMDGAVCVRVHFNAVQVAANQWNQSREFLVLSHEKYILKISALLKIHIERQIMKLATIL